MSSTTSITHLHRRQNHTPKKTSMHNQRQKNREERERKKAPITSNVTGKSSFPSSSNPIAMRAHLPARKRLQTKIEAGENIINNNNNTVLSTFCDSHRCLRKQFPRPLRPISDLEQHERHLYHKYAVLLPSLPYPALVVSPPICSNLVCSPKTSPCFQNRLKDC